MLLLFISLSLPTQAERQLTTLSLNHQSAEELLPIIRAYLQSPSSANIYRDHLVISATVNERQQIQQLLQQLDQSGRQLVISVKIQGQENQQQQQWQIQQQPQSQAKPQIIRSSNNGVIAEITTTTTVRHNSSSESESQGGEQLRDNVHLSN